MALFAGLASPFGDAGAQASAASDWQDLAARAEAHFVSERYDSAVELGQRACGGLWADGGLADSVEVKLLLRQAEYLREAARFDSAHACLVRADSLCQTAEPEWTPPKSTCVLSWAELRFAQSQFPEAESLYLEVTELHERTPAAPPRERARALAGLGNLYFRTDRMLEAEELQNRALHLQREHLPADDPDIARVLGRLAMVSAEAGRTDQVEPLLLQSIGIFERCYGPDHPRVAQMLANLGLWYNAQDRRPEAIVVLKRSLEIRERALGPDHPKLAFALVNLANTYRNEGLEAEALPLLTRAYEIRVKAYGPVHQYVAFSLNYLASAYEDVGQLDSAEAARRQIVQINSQLLPAGHIEQIGAQVGLGVSLIRQGKNREALVTVQDALERGLDRFHRFAPTLSDYEALIASNAVHAPLDVMLSAAQQIRDIDSPTINQIANAILAVKGEFADELFDRAAMARIIQDPQLSPVADTLLRCLDALKRIPVATPSGRGEAETRRLDSLDLLKRRMERTIASQTHLFKAQARAVHAAEIEGHLPDGTSAVEFVRYHDRMVPSFKPVLNYAALVLRPGQAPALRFLGPAKGLDSLIHRYQDHMLAFSRDRRLPSRIDDDEYRTLAGNLYELVWRAIEPLTAGSELVLVSPDAALSQLSFGTLVCPDGAFLLERHTLHYLDALRDLPAPHPDPTQGVGLLAMGNPDFDRRTDPRPSNAGWAAIQNSREHKAMAAGVRATCATMKNEKAAPLPATGTEVERAVERWRRHGRLEAEVRTGVDATEEAFKAEAPGRLVVHLATHGFAWTQRCLETHSGLDEISKRVFVEENPLLLSGLLLAGANGDPALADSLGREDGILSAYEIAGLDLSGVRLAILSACESGLGVARNHEGLFGVRRAFHLAGVGTVVSALWPVPDQSTEGLIVSLYDNPSESVAGRLRAAQLAQIQALRTAGFSAHPYTWGAFIVSGRR